MTPHKCYCSDSRGLRDRERAPSCPCRVKWLAQALKPSAGERRGAARAVEGRGARCRLRLASRPATLCSGRCWSHPPAPCAASQPLRLHRQPAAASGSQSPAVRRPTLFCRALPCPAVPGPPRGMAWHAAASCLSRAPASGWAGGWWTGLSWLRFASPRQASRPAAGDHVPRGWQDVQPRAARRRPGSPCYSAGVPAGGGHGP